MRWREFEELMQPYLSTHTAMEIVMTAQALRLPFAFVPTAADLLADEHLAERGFFEKHRRAGGRADDAGAAVQDVGDAAAGGAGAGARERERARCSSESWATRRTT